ncbi:hypothetical protein LMG19282_04219 [Cupriavidus campinensis]|uniref:hypothetical protein n=1 Tax=Cupriavidus campinensis TaxID=151783 RepID=UPI001B159CD5|nr:hypothetical protein [Cupriavidus campinensis]CAG2152570.1 hypothetical protein LMG19282_04219 [Cupriavidus campinensis]
MSEQTDLKVVAVVEMNKGEALVLNRRLKLTYERDGKGFIGSDGPFRDVLYYSRASTGFKAFAGREFELQMKDGTVETIKDHWWNGHLNGSVSVAHGDVESLRKCYVFFGGTCIDPAALAELRATYSGCVYPYRDYEKVIKYDHERQWLWSKLLHEEKRNRALVKAVKAKHGHLAECVQALEVAAAALWPYSDEAKLARAALTKASGEQS